MGSQIFVARTSFVRTIDGERYHVPAGSTVREGHPLLSGGDTSVQFEPFKVDFEVAPRGPGRLPKGR